VPKAYNREVKTEAQRIARRVTQRKYQAKRQAGFRAFLDWVRTNIRCKDCGGFGVEFHHQDPATRIFGINIRAFCRAWRVIVTELLKCEPLCRLCHQKRHRTMMTRRRVPTAARASRSPR
jgi:hypothetical protein